MAKNACDMLQILAGDLLKGSPVALRDPPDALVILSAARCRTFPVEHIPKRGQAQTTHARITQIFELSHVSKPEWLGAPNGGTVHTAPDERRSRSVAAGYRGSIVRPADSAWLAVQ